MHTIESLIGNAGGTQAFADMVGRSRTTIIGWRKAGNIPATMLLTVSRVTGIAVDDLAHLVAPPQ